MTTPLQLTRYDGEDGIEILIDPVTNDSFCSVVGYARMSGISSSTIRVRLGKAIKTAEIFTSGGLQTIRLVTEDQITKWLPTDNPVMASKLIRTCGQIASQYQWQQDDRAIFDEFLANLKIATDGKMLGRSMKVNVAHQGHKHIAIHLPPVLDLLASRLGYSPDVISLQRAIVKHGGKIGQTHRFDRFEPESPAKNNGLRSIVRKCIVIPTSLF